jgi:uridine kinase
MQDFQQVTAALTKQVAGLLDIKPTPILLIDGRAASGKSTLAQDLENALFRELQQAPKVVHMDDLYPGWEGLKAGSQYLVQNILQPLSQGKTAHWQIWDWAKNERGNSAEPGNGWREFAGGTPLIIEGCGSLSRASKELADLSIWLEVDLAVRRQRWQDRDGEAFDEYWPSWMVQEDEFYQVERSKELADLVLTKQSC